MSSEAQAGTPTETPETREAETPAVESADGSGLNAQQQKEWMTLKQKAENYNRLEKEKADLEARLVQMERLAFSRGAGTATDPEAERLAQLREQAAFDPMAAELLATKHRQAVLEAEVWLQTELASVPATKRDQVAALIRNANYQMRANDALKLVTDPESDAAQKRLAELEAENARLKARAAQPNGASPAAVAPATSSGVENSKETIAWTEALRTLKRGGPEAKALRDQMDAGAVRPDYTK